MNVLYITEWFDPEPTFKGLSFAKKLISYGCNVTVITGFPNYPGGIVYPGYRVKMFSRETIDGVDIRRVPLYPSHDSSPIRRILTYASFGMSSLFYGLFLRGKFDVILSYHPPLTVGIAASIISFFRRVPLVYDVQDMWPDTLAATGMVKSRLVLKAVSKVCDVIYKSADAIVVLSPGFKNLLIGRGVPSNKINVIYNWAEEGVLNNPLPTLDSYDFSESHFNIVYAGNCGFAQGLDIFIEVAKYLSTDSSPVRFTIIGGGLDLKHLKLRVKNYQLNNVAFLNPLPMNKIGAVLGRADALLVSLVEDPLFEITIPSKIQAYMSLGKPLLAMVKGDAASIIESAHCGVVFTKRTTEHIAEKIQDFSRMDKVTLEQMGKRGKKYYEDNLSLNQGAIKFLDIFNKIRY